MHWYGSVNNGPHRVNHAAVAVGNIIFSFGGYSQCPCYVMADSISVSSFNTEMFFWSNIHYSAKSEGAIPPELYAHTAVEYNRKIYLWGGRVDDMDDDFALNRLYCFDADSYEWSLPEVKGEVPDSRFGHTANVVNSNMYIFGGNITQSSTYASMGWILRLNLQTFIWERISIQNFIPYPRTMHTSSVIGTKIYTFGGLLNYNSADYYCKSMAYLDTETMLWLLPVSSGTRPSGRRSHSAVVFQNQIYIFFGFNEEFLNDIYKFNPENNDWSEIISNYGDWRKPCKRRRQCCIVVNKRMFAFGGVSMVDCFPCSHSPEHNSSNPLFAENLDLHIFDFFPTLKNLCMTQVMYHDLNIDRLPMSLKNEINYFRTGNQVSETLCPYC